MFWLQYYLILYIWILEIWKKKESFLTYLYWVYKHYSVAFLGRCHLIFSSFENITKSYTQFVQICLGPRDLFPLIWHLLAADWSPWSRDWKVLTGSTYHKKNHNCFLLHLRSEVNSSTYCNILVFVIWEKKDEAVFVAFRCCFFDSYWREK